MSIEVELTAEMQFFQS